MKILALERRTKRGMMPSLFLAPGVQDGTPDVEGWFAEVSADGFTLECSRLDDETHWTVDAIWSDKRGPIFSNGFGARYLMTKTPADEIAELLDAELAKVMLAGA